uniref:NACHT domain-containing protein n=1 Tax=Anopheles atroparvus TaxID=41427 RepID=A0AAG5D9F0_ANOAO
MRKEQPISKAGVEKAKNTNRSNNNNNKASKDGVDFQYHLFYYVIGLCHYKYDYAARYEGEMGTYGALDDVILKINSNEDGTNPKALYLIQAKQFQKEDKQISLLDLLHPGDGFTKYIESYNTYKSSETCKQDGLPAQMIYWTSVDLHSTTKQVMEVFESHDDHLKIPIKPETPIQKYWIKHWKKLFIFEIASKLKNCAESAGKNVDEKKCKCESVANVLIREAVQQVEVQTESGSVQKLQLRKEFLYRGDSLSKNAVILRDCLDLAYQTIGKRPDCAKLEARTFDDIFGLDFTSALNPDRDCTFEYKGLNEEELDWFFQHFVYYVNVPKGERMIQLLKDETMFGENFKEQFFEKHLITNPTVGSSFVGKSFINSLIKTLQVTSKPLVTCVEFSETQKLRDRIGSFLKEDPIKSPTLTIIAKTIVDWTVSRVVREVRKTSSTCVVVQDTDTKMLSEALCTIEEKLILSEIQTIVAVDLKKVLQLPTGIRMISIVPADARDIDEASCFEDQIDLNDIEVHFEQFEDRKISIDGNEIGLTEFCGKEVINDKMENLMELYNLKKLEVKSDIFHYDEKHYIERELLEKNNVVDHGTLTSDQTQLISIISDTAGQGKTVELLRIAKNVQTPNNSTNMETICLYFRAKTIAKDIPPTHLNSLNAFQYLPKLLHLEPKSPFMEGIVLKCLERYKVILLVDGFDEIVDDSQAVVIKFMKSALEQTSCSIVIATRTEAQSKLESAFKNAKCYTLGKFAYEKYFQQLWLKERAEPPTETLESNMNYFIENFDNLLKRAGCKLFLEVPQFCRIMGSIYQDRIDKPNFKLHNNYEIGAIYDTFVHSQFANTFEGYFDENNLKDAMALRVLRTDFLTKHMELAYYNQYQRCKEATLFKDLTYYDLIVNQDDQYEFIHITVMEYFLVRYFMLEDIDLDRYETKDTFLNFLQRYFCVSRANIADKFIDFFLTSNKLTKKKRHVIVRYLQSNSKHLPTFVRTTLNNATFNTLKLLLSTAPESMLLDLCFRFGSVKQTNDGKKGKGKDAISDVSTENEINLKRLGENQVILLLQALKESGDGRPKIIKNVLFPTDPNVEDILEVSIRKPFPEVFDEVVKYCTDNCVEDFKDHVEGRLERYAQVIVQHCYAENKERMIDKIIHLCKHKLNGRTISGYVQGFDLFKIIVENIEVVTAGKKFIEKDRLDMLGKLLGLIDAYVDPGTLALRKQEGREQLSNLKNASIKNRLFEWLDE